MKIIDILEEDKIILNYHFISKKRLFETMAQLLGEHTQESLQIYHGLVDREKLGNTSLGNGIAVPHGKCLTENNLKACVIQMAQPIDYEAIDGVPVDVVLGIAFPEIINKKHKILMKVTAELFRQHRLYKNLVKATSKEQIIEEILVGFELCNSW